MATMADEDLTPEPDAPERDPDTADMFGDPAPAQPAAAPAPAGDAAYTVIARKYRPRTFEPRFANSPC